MSRAIIRVARLDSRLSDLATAGTLAMPEPVDVPKMVKLTVKDGPNVKFKGAAIDSYSQNPERIRFEELMLFAVVGGEFLAARAWHSNVDGEATFWTVSPVDTVADCMAAWGWSDTAKGFAKRLHWDAVRYYGEAPK
jgi:hypothetical protein